MSDRLPRQEAVRQEDVRQDSNHHLITQSLGRLLILGNHHHHRQQAPLGNRRRQENHPLKDQETRVLILVQHTATCHLRQTDIEYALTE